MNKKNALKQKQYERPPGMGIDPANSYTATIETSLGDMVLRLWPETAPVAVNNFVFLARDGFYDDSCFHRVIRGFMVQGGCPERTGRGGPGYSFQDEPVTQPYTKGVLAMANSGPNTNGSQFFIVHAPEVELPPKYTIFGNLASGEDVLDALAGSPVTAGAGGERSRPTDWLVIRTVRISEAGETAEAPEE